MIDTQSPDADFDRRWRAWEARGVAQDRIVRRRFAVLASIVAVAVLVALIASVVLSR